MWPSDWSIFYQNTFYWKNDFSTELATGRGIINMRSTPQHIIKYAVEKFHSRYSFVLLQYSFKVTGNWALKYVYLNVDCYTFVWVSWLPVYMYKCICTNLVPLHPVSCPRSQVSCSQFCYLLITVTTHTHTQWTRLHEITEINACAFIIYQLTLLYSNMPPEDTMYLQTLEKKYN